MVDTQLLEDAIVRSGKKKSYLADKLGVSIQAFRLKMKNENQFTPDEIMGLCDELYITKLSEKDKIFFKRKVE